jgi:probable F420-dependent oxidoreductase
VKIGVVLLAAEVDGDGSMPSWVDARAFALAAERAEVDSVWMFDHFFNRLDDGTVEGMYEAWTILSAVAAVTERVLLGTLVMCGSFRHPGLLAKMAATLDEVSDGRLILGIGAGWHDPEYKAFGYPTDRRVGRFEEVLRILRALLDGERVTLAGRFHELHDAVLAPGPRRRIPLLVAGDGPRMLRLTARYADAWNINGFGEPDDEVRSVLSAFEAAVREEGRDPDTIERTLGVTVRDPDAPAHDDEPAFRGSAEEMATMFRAYADLGVDHLILEISPKTEASLERVGRAAAMYRSVG